MRLVFLSALILLAIVDLASSQTIDISSGRTANQPVYRPALLGTGPNALINRIDTLDLIKKGQKDAAIMFTCTVKKTGEIVWSGTYRGTADSKLLEEELHKKLADAKFVPGIYNREPVDAIYYGTVTFALVDGKPRLRIFSNQETKELEKETDFVGPQPFFGGDSKFAGLQYPVDEAPVLVSATVELDLKIDETGNLTDIKLRTEKPPFLGFGESALASFRNAKFIPAFRDGKPVACAITLPVYYQRKD